MFVKFQKFCTMNVDRKHYQTTAMSAKVMQMRRFWFSFSNIVPRACLLGERRTSSSIKEDFGNGLIDFPVNFPKEAFRICMSIHQEYHSTSGYDKSKLSTA